jgi:hypothetical protein
LTGVNSFVTNPLLHSAMQQGEKVTAMNGKLRPPVARRQTPWFAPDSLTVLGVIRQLPRGYGHCRQFIKEAKFSKLTGGVGQDVDSDAEFLDGRGRFKNVNVGNSGIVKRQRNRQSADAAPCDEHPHGFALTDPPAQMNVYTTMRQL